MLTIQLKIFRGTIYNKIHLLEEKRALGHIASEFEPYFANTLSQWHNGDNESFPSGWPMWQRTKQIDLHGNGNPRCPRKTPSGILRSDWASLTLGKSVSLGHLLKVSLTLGRRVWQSTRTLREAHLWPRSRVSSHTIKRCWTNSRTAVKTGRRGRHRSSVSRCEHPRRWPRLWRNRAVTYHQASTNTARPLSVGEAVTRGRHVDDTGLRLYWRGHLGCPLTVEKKSSAPRPRKLTLTATKDAPAPRFPREIVYGVRRGQTLGRHQGVEAWRGETLHLKPSCGCDDELRCFS